MPALQAVRSELATLKEELSRRQAIDQYPTRISEPTIIPSTYRLSQLSSKGRGESCDHCHICASSDHWARGCRKKNTGGNKAGSGNRRRLHPQDRKQPTCLKTLGSRNAFVVKELQGRIKFSSSVQVAYWFGIVDRGARNFTGAVTRRFVRRLNILKQKRL